MPGIEKKSESLVGLNPALIGSLSQRAQELLVQDLEEEVLERAEAKKKKKAQKEELRKAGVELAKAYGSRQRALQARCSHMKPRNQGTRVVGTRLTGGQVFWNCQACQKEWFDPPRNGQLALPRDLVAQIDPDEIGG
jgi:hypothetical protein